MIYYNKNNITLSGGSLTVLFQWCHPFRFYSEIKGFESVIMKLFYKNQIQMKSILHPTWCDLLRGFTPN